ncbi:MAG: hypothetical protein GF421_05535 [Candidatus Aminicenantes bacterium]|nr:hypothetical protein [Candidatus Aminicenantes bacterium]
MSSDHQGRIVSGIVIILIGFIFLMSSMGRLDLSDFLSTYWPLILIFLGIWHVINQNFRLSGFGLMLILIGAFFLLVNWNVLSAGFWRIFWPVLIIGIGLWIILKPKGFKGKVPKIKDDDLGAFVIFSGMKRQIESKQFRGGKATAVFGGIELDFHSAQLSEGQATVELTALFGAAEVFVPKDWKIVLDSNAIFGAVEDKRKDVSPEKDQAILFIRASAVFGAIEIKN